MVTKYRYTMKINPQKILDLAESATGVRPDGMGKSGLHTWSIDYEDVDIDAGQRAALVAALPEWVRFMYDFSREVVVEEE
jgi:hypothetical protein